MTPSTISIQNTGETEIDPDLRFRTVSPEAVARQTAKIAERFEAFLADQPWMPRRSPTALHDMISAYRTLYDARPIRDNSGGSKFESGLWIYLVGHLFQPDRIIESGTHKGFSAWLWRQVTPNAEISTFDVSHAHLEHRERNVHYNEQDWMAAPLSIDAPDQTLVFFDDHINHCQRILEAAERGAKWIMLDDNFASYQVHATGTPPVPTGAMICEETLSDGEVLQWRRNGKTYSHVFSAEDARQAREKIKHYARLPSAFDITRYRPHANMTLLELTA